MTKNKASISIIANDVLRLLTSGPQIFALLPAVILGGYWLGGEKVMIAIAVGLPAVVTLLGMTTGIDAHRRKSKDAESGLVVRPIAEQKITDVLNDEQITGKSTAALVLHLEDIENLDADLGRLSTARLFRMVSDRIAANCRDDDVLARLGPHRIGIAFSGMQRADLETIIQIATRLQAELSEPFSLDATRVFTDVSIGFCLPGRAPDRSGETILKCAEVALEEARANGPGSIRAYSPGLNKRKRDRSELSGEFEVALSAGQIEPWFQPRLCTDSGAILAMAALARWDNPVRGIILPGDFASAAHAQGLEARMTEILLNGCLSAIVEWDAQGIGIPMVSIQLPHSVLCDPNIREKILWELDRFDLEPNRLGLEITEDLILAGTEKDLDDILPKNIRALSSMGCRIELGAFGTGNASITRLKNLSIDQINIDKSFITRVDRDNEQQNMVTAILTMAEQLNLATLATGVDTAGEHAMLAQLGCNAVQGHTISCPMRANMVADWAKNYALRLPSKIALPGNSAG